MTIFPPGLKALAIAAGIAGASAGALVLARPQPIENAVLGTDWACTRTAFVLTTCAPRGQQALPAVETLRKDAIQATRG
jgi:hypothetical protein